MQHTLSQLTMLPGGAGRLHLELVFLIKTLTQIQPSSLIKAPVSKNVYIQYVSQSLLSNFGLLQKCQRLGLCQKEVLIFFS
jgi:hypothetical protein